MNAFAKPIDTITNRYRVHRVQVQVTPYDGSHALVFQEQGPAQVVPHAGAAGPADQRRHHAVEVRQLVADNVLYNVCVSPHAQPLVDILISQEPERASARAAQFEAEAALRVEQKRRTNLIAYLRAAPWWRRVWDALRGYPELQS